jgi:hypothetical protein
LTEVEADGHTIREVDTASGSCASDGGGAAPLLLSSPRSLSTCLGRGLGGHDTVGGAEGVSPHLRCCNPAASPEGAHRRLPLLPYERERTEDKIRGEIRVIRWSKTGVTGSDDFCGAEPFPYEWNIPSLEWLCS